MSKKLDFDRERKRTAATVRGTQLIDPEDSTLPPSGRPHVDREDIGDGGSGFYVKNIGFRQEPLDVAREAILQTERLKQKRKQAKAAAADKKAAAAAASQKAKKTTRKKISLARSPTIVSPGLVLQAFPRGKTRQVIVEVGKLPPSRRDPPGGK